MPHVQTIRTIDPEQNSAYHRKHLIKEQAGFRPGMSCTSQLLNLTQHIEYGYQVGKITGTAFVDLSAAYDTVNHRLLIQKLYNTTQDSKLCRVIQNLLSNRRLYVEPKKERIRWRKKKKGMLHQRPADPLWNQELHLRRRSMYHGPVPIIQAG